MPKQGVYIIVTVAVAILLTAGLSFFDTNPLPTGPGQYDDLAICLNEKGVKFYGAFWCPHCAEQKKVFGASAKLLPYVECSTPDAGDSLQVCKDADIKSYPTWVFPDGSRTSGMTPAELASKSGCPLANATSTAIIDISALSATSSTIK